MTCRLPRSSIMTCQTNLNYRNADSDQWWRSSIPGPNNGHSWARASSVAGTSRPNALGRATRSVPSPVSDLLPEIAIVREPSQRLVVAGRYDPGQQQPENRVRKRGAKTCIEVDRIEFVPHPEFRFVA